MGTISIGRPGEIFGSELDGILDGRFHLDLLDMQLCQRSTNEVKYRGSGFVQMDDGGQLRLTLYDPDRSASFGESFRHAGTRRWATAADEFDLTAIDVRGRSWSASRLHVDVSGRDLGAGVVCRAHVHELEYRTQVTPRQQYVSIILRGHTPLPPGYDEWTQQEESVRITIENRNDASRVRAESVDQPLPAWVHWRLEETLFASTGRLAHWYVMAAEEAGQYTFKLRARPQPVRMGRLDHPVDTTTSGRAEDFEAFFSCYYKYVSSFEESRYHPMSTKLYQVFRSGSISIYDEAVMLSTGIERLAKLLFGAVVELPELAPAELATLQGIVEEHVPERLKARMLGCVQSMSQPSASDILNRLVELDVLAPDHFRLWKRVRNTASHGEEFSAPYTRIADNNTALVIVLFRLVMQAIGYRGQYVDWGSPYPSSIEFVPVDLGISR